MSSTFPLRPDMTALPIRRCPLLRARGSRRRPISGTKLRAWLTTLPTAAAGGQFPQVTIRIRKVPGVSAGCLVRCCLVRYGASILWHVLQIGVHLFFRFHRATDNHSCLVVRKLCSPPGSSAVGFESAPFHQEQREVGKLKSNDSLIDLNVRKAKCTFVERQRSVRIADRQTNNSSSYAHMVSL